MTTKDIVQNLYSWRYVVNQGCHGLKGQSLPCINGCMSQFLQISRLVALASMGRFTSDHMFCIGFISGKRAGHFMCSILSVSMKSTTVQALWGLALSSCTLNYAQMSHEQMAITFPTGSVGTGTDPGFHRRCEGQFFHRGGKHPIW